MNIPRLTPAHINEQVVAHEFHVFPDTTVTVCLMTLRNGAKVIGYNYGSIDPEAQNWELGKNNAYFTALEKVWELEGYLLRDFLHANREQAVVKEFAFEQGLNDTTAYDIEKLVAPTVLEPDEESSGLTD